MAEELRQYSERSRHEVSDLCVIFYTQDTFLYFALNRALRECDLTKLETLGPFAYLLNNHVRRCKEYCGTVYRCAQLDATHIEQYKKTLGTWRSWPAYTSASQGRAAADVFGSTLFVITIVGGLPTTPRAFDVSDFSDFPEAEIMIRPGISFLIQSVDQDSKGNHTIHLRI